MQHTFKIKGKPEKIDLIPFIVDFFKDHSRGEIKELIIGTDSQNFRTTSVYVVAIILKHRFNRGARVISTKITKPRIDNIRERLSAESMFTYEVAKYLKENGITITEFNLDYNKKKKTKSHDLVKEYSWLNLEFPGATLLAKDGELNTLLSIAAADKILR